MTASTTYGCSLPHLRLQVSCIDLFDVAGQLSQVTLVVASDGLWDLWQYKDVLQYMLGKPPAGITLTLTLTLTLSLTPTPILTLTLTPTLTLTLTPTLSRQATARRHGRGARAARHPRRGDAQAGRAALHLQPHVAQPATLRATACNPTSPGEELFGEQADNITAMFVCCDIKPQ